MNISAHTTRCRALLALLFMPALSLTAQPTPVPAAPFDVPLYAGAPTGAPLSTKAEVFVQAAGDPIARITHVQTPDMRVFLPSATTATGTAIVIFPGGGYGILAIDHEGWAVARWLTAQGIAAIVVKYRVSDTEGERYRFPVPLLDARQALRVVRERAAGWGIDPTRVGVMGFSAGGHLTSMLLTTFNDALPGESVATNDSLRIRPDFGVLVYPVITLHEPWGHRGSSDNLFGASATQERRQQYSSERRVTAATPPTFLVATQDDQAVPVQNSIAFYQAMTAQRVAGELHVWERGGHGFGMLAAQGPVATEWLPRLVDWMRGRGLLRRARDT
ncbi:MAG: alpha/beta hydrolase [Gemmatimonadaceae bacterium]|nr:alpha/beta hydrolase [Gemmatimonadaceae bacterium]